VLALRVLEPQPSAQPLLLLMELRVLVLLVLRQPVSRDCVLRRLQRSRKRRGRLS
jgi:hypothetical protein